MVGPPSPARSSTFNDGLNLGQSADAAEIPSESLMQDDNPFLCNICKRSYSRIDHLARHYRSHTNEKPFPCHLCNKDFARADLLKRHVNAHKDEETSRKRQKVAPPPTRPRVSQACIACAEAKLKCEQQKPCRRCQEKQILCEYPPARAKKPNSRRDSQAPSRPEPAEDYQDLGTQGQVQSQQDNTMDAFTQHHSMQNLGLHETPNQMLVDPNQMPTPITFGQVSTGATDPSTAMDHDPMMTFDDSSLADFLRDIMMPSSPGAGLRQFGTDPTGQPFTPRDLLNFGVDYSLDLPDLDTNFQLPFMEDLPQISHMSLPQNMRLDLGNQGIASGTRTPEIRNRIDLGARAFQESLWQWTPAQQDHGYAEQLNLSLPHEDINFSKTRMPAEGQAFESRLEQRSRDRILAMILGTCEQAIFSRVVASFPSADLLTNLIHGFFSFHQSQTDTWIHLSSIQLNELRPELLGIMIAMGAVLSGIQVIRKLGFAIQEAVRLAVPQLFEGDNRTTRDLETLQAYGLQLDVGLWSGDRRKMEMAESHAQPLITMLRRAGQFRKPKQLPLVPDPGDDPSVLENKWLTWVEAESWKRLAFHLLIRDVQTSMSLLVPPLISYAEVSAGMPFSRELWMAKNSVEWRDVYLSKMAGLDERLPSLPRCIHDVEPLSKLQEVVDINLAILIILHGIWTLIWEYRQLNTVVKLHSTNTHWNSALITTSLHQELCQLLQHFHMDAADWGAGMQPEAVLVYERSLMNLHVSFDDLQLFAGKEGEEEARRVFPLLTQWAGSRESRQSVWHAGQVLRAAKHFRTKNLRESSATALYHASLALWAYDVVSKPLKKSGRGPARVPSVVLDSSAAAAVSQDNGLVWLDGEDCPAVQRYLVLNRGVPAIRRWGESNNLDNVAAADQKEAAYFAPLSDPKTVMDIIIDILRRKSKGDDKSCPPLVENLSQLMRDLGNAAWGMRRS